MARTDTLNNFLTDVANAIKEKTGNEEAIPANEFDTQISNMSTYTIESGTFETTLSSSTNSATVTLDYRPKAVIIYGTIASDAYIAGYAFDDTFADNLPITFKGGYTSLAGSANKKWSLTISDTGFRIYNSGYSPASTYKMSGTYMVIK